MSFIDTPDYQAGIVHPQQLLTSQSSGTTSATVQMPVNTQTLVVICQGGSGAPTVTVVGDSTGISYPGTMLAAGKNTDPNSVCFFFNMAACIDQFAVVSVTGGGSPNWWAYSDAAHHVITNFGPS